jgi:feruloyl esterase
LGRNDQLRSDGGRGEIRIRNGVDGYGSFNQRGSFAVGHPEKLIDFSWRSEHEMTGKAKVLVEAYYGSAPRRSYWNGCSTGGRQALKEAQMFPADFDGTISRERRANGRRPM